MPVTLEEVLPLDDLKRAIRVDGDFDDARVTMARDAAVRYCEGFYGFPIITRTGEYEVNRPRRAEDPAWIPAAPISITEAVKYWTTSGKRREEPNGTIAAADLGRVKQSGYKMTKVWPPANGWPEMLRVLEQGRRAYSPMEFTVTEGYDSAADIPDIEGIREAMILQARINYDGLNDPMHMEAVRRMAEFYQHGSVRY